MANILYANNAAGTLLAGITNASTSLTLGAGQGAKFPSPVPPQVFYVTLTDAATQTLIEIVQVTAVSGDIFSIVRAQDGTSALSWNAGDIVSQRTIALELRGFENAAEGAFAAQAVAITPSTTLGIVGTTLGDNANAGSVGQILTQTPAATGLTTATPVGIASVGLTPGDWDVSGTAYFVASSGAVLVTQIASTSSVNNVIGPQGSFSSLVFTSPANGGSALTTPVLRYNVSTNTTVFLTAQANFSSGFCTAQGVIRARRVR